MAGPSSIDKPSSPRCPYCPSVEMLVLESELPYTVYYCPRCQFTIKDSEWRKRRKRHSKTEKKE